MDDKTKSTGGSQSPDEGSETLRPETEAGKAGGVQPAREKAERDWEHSAKEDGE